VVFFSLFVPLALWVCNVFSFLPLWLFFHLPCRPCPRIFLASPLFFVPGFLTPHFPFLFFPFFFLFFFFPFFSFSFFFFLFFLPFFCFFFPSFFFPPFFFLFFLLDIPGILDSKSLFGLGLLFGLCIFIFFPFSPFLRPCNLYYPRCFSFCLTCLLCPTVPEYFTPHVSSFTVELGVFVFVFARWGRRTSDSLYEFLYVIIPLSNLPPHVSTVFFQLLLVFFCFTALILQPWFFFFFPFSPPSFVMSPCSFCFYYFFPIPLLCMAAFILRHPFCPRPAFFASCADYSMFCETRQLRPATIESQSFFEMKNWASLSFPASLLFSFPPPFVPPGLYAFSYPMPHFFVVPIFFPPVPYHFAAFLTVASWPLAAISRSNLQIFSGVMFFVLDFTCEVLKYGGVFVRLNCVCDWSYWIVTHLLLDPRAVSHLLRDPPRALRSEADLSTPFFVVIIWRCPLILIVLARTRPGSSTVFHSLLFYCFSVFS